MTNISHTPGDSIEVSVEVRKAPDGRDGILFQEPNSWMFFMNPEDARVVARALLEAADELDEKRSGGPREPKPPKHVTFGKHITFRNKDE